MPPQTPTTDRRRRPAGHYADPPTDPRRNHPDDLRLTQNVSLRSCTRVYSLPERYCERMEAPVSIRLFDVAERHGGYFTTAEALGASISNRVLTHYVGRGVLERVAHGIYHLVAYPSHAHSDLLVATLWAGSGSAVSHESALAVYAVAQAAPPVIHLTVPRPFRGRRPGVRIHLADLPASATQVWDDVPVTSVERTLIDVATTSDPSLVRDAVHESLERGLTTRTRLTLALSEVTDGRTQIRRAWGVRLKPAPEPR